MFVPGWLDPFVAPKQALLLLGASASVGVLLASSLAAPRGSLRPRGAFEWLVLLWLAVAAVSTLRGVSPLRSLLGEPAQREGLVTLAALAALALASRRAHREVRARQFTLNVLLVGSAAAAAYALLQHAGLDPIAWANPTHFIAGGTDSVRPGSTLGSAILLGVVLAPALAVTTAQLLAEPARLRLHAPLAALLTAALLATLSRGAWLGAALGVGVAIVLASRGRSAPRSTMARALLLGFGPALLWGAIVLGAPIVARLTESVDPAATSGPARLAIAEAAFAMFRAHPLLGAGPDTFGLLFSQFQPASYARQAWIGSPMNAHSAALQTLATVGALGALSLLAVAAPLRGAGRKRAERDPEAGAILAALTALIAAACVEPLGITGAAMLAALAGMRVASADPDAAAPPPAEPLLAPAFGGLVALIACGITLSGWLRASIDGGIARTRFELATRSSPVEAWSQGASAARSAMYTSPFDDVYAQWSSDLRLALSRHLAFTRDTLGAIQQADIGLADAERAVLVEPLRASGHQRVGTALAQLATLAPTDTVRAQRAIASRAAFARARRLAPHDPLLLVECARAALDQRAGDWALASAEALLALSPDSGTAWALKAAALLQLGRSEQAREALDAAALAPWEAGSERERAMVELARRTLEARSTSRAAQGSASAPRPDPAP